MQTRNTFSWIKEQITRSNSVSLMIYIITRTSISSAYPVFAQQGYENPREATGRIVCANCHLASKPVDIEVPQAVLPDTVFEAVVRILVNSRPGLVTATPFLRRHPFSRSYGAILPSFLERVVSFPYVFSTYPPVSVSGTGSNMSSRQGIKSMNLFYFDLFESRKNREIDSTSNSNEEIIQNIVSKYLNSANSNQVFLFEE